MNTPFETTLSLWFRSIADYAWEPEPEPEPPRAPTLDAPDASAAPPEAQACPAREPAVPPMRLVFKGLRWTLQPVYGMRENLAWSDASATRQSVDEQHRDENSRLANRAPRPRGTDGNPL